MFVLAVCSVVVVYQWKEEDEKKEKKEKKEKNPNNLDSEKRMVQNRIMICERQISSVSYARNGKYLVIGERGNDSGISVIEVETMKLVMELFGHENGVKIAMITPNSEKVVSVGMHDHMIKVWDWQNNKIAFECRSKQAITGMDFSRDGAYFVTSCGKGMMQYWSFDNALNCMDAKLGEFEREDFVDVVCSRALSISVQANFVFAATASGRLLCFDSSRTLEKWVDVKMSPLALSICSNNIAIAGYSGNEGITRIFTCDTFKHICTLPKVKSKVVGVTLSDEVVYCLHEDLSIVCYNISKPKCIDIICTRPSYSEAIWDILNFSPTPESKDLFVTCGADNSIRFWNFDSDQELVYTIENAPENLEPEHASEASANVEDDRLEFIFNSEGIKAIAVSPLSDYLLSGDKNGKLNLYSLKQNNQFDLLGTIQSHNVEVTRLSISGSSDCNSFFFASAFRDGTVHVHEMSSLYIKETSTASFPLVASFNHHSGAVSGLAFCANGTRLLSSGADKSLIFREVKPALKKFPQISKQTLPRLTHDLLIHPNQKFAATCGADKLMHVWNLQSGKMIRSYKLADTLNSSAVLSSVGSEPNKICFDPSGLYVMVSSNDKYLKLYDWLTGKLLARVKGHTDLITGMSFSADGSQFVSVSSDGCIFVWIVSPSIVGAIKNRLQEMKNGGPLSARADSSDKSIDEPNPRDRSNSSSIVPQENEKLVFLDSSISAESIIIDRSDVASAETLALSKLPLVDNFVAEELKEVQTDNVFNVNSKSQSPFRTAHKLLPVLADVPAWARSVAPSSVSNLLQNSSPEHVVFDSFLFFLIQYVSARPESRWAQRVKNEEFKIFSPELPEDNGNPVVLTSSIDVFMSTIAPNNQDDFAALRQEIEVQAKEDVLQNQIIANSAILSAEISATNSGNELTDASNTDQNLNLNVTYGDTTIREETVSAFASFDEEQLFGFASKKRVLEVPSLDFGSVFEQVLLLPPSETQRVDNSEDAYLVTIQNLETTMEATLRLFSNLESTSTQPALKDSMKSKLVSLQEKLSAALSIEPEKEYSLSHASIDKIADRLFFKLEQSISTRMEQFIHDRLTSEWIKTLQSKQTVEEH